jgi:hypothetical protein
MKPVFDLELKISATLKPLYKVQNYPHPGNPAAFLPFDKLAKISITLYTNTSHLITLLSRAADPKK